MKRRQFISRAGKALLVFQSISLGFQASAQTIQEDQIIIDKIKANPQFKGRTITLLYPKGSKPNLIPIVRDFKERTNITVKLREGSLDNIASEILLQDRLDKLNTIDIALPSTFSIPDLAEAGVIEDLTSLAKKFEPANFRDSSLYTLGDTYNSKFYGYQADGDAYIMFYHRDFLENKKFQVQYRTKFGVDLAVPQTWQELDRQIKFFNRPKEGLFGGSLFRNKDYLAWEFWARLHAKGVYPVDENMKPRFTQREAIEALTELIETSKSLSPHSAKDGLFDNFKHFSQGKSYCNIGWGGTQKYLRSSNSLMKGRIIHAPLPGGNFGGKNLSIPYFNWGWNYVVSRKSTQKELAYLFSLFANTARLSTKAVREEEGYFDPHRREHYQDSAIKETYGDRFLKVHHYSLKNSIPDFYIRGQGEYFEALKRAIHLSNTQKLEPKLALSLAAKKWEQLTSKLGRANQIKQWKKLKNSYPKELKKELK